MLKKRQTFKDPNLQRQFEKDGYVIVPFFTEDQIQTILKVFENENSGIQDGFYTTPLTADKSHRKKVNSLLQKHSGGIPHEYFSNYKLQGAAFVVKLPGKKSEVSVHQDWTQVEEPYFTSVNVFIPLTEMTEENGSFEVMKGSHRLFNGILRGSPSHPTPLDELQEEIIEKYLTTPIVKRGEAVMHNHALVHYSKANLSKIPRVAMMLNMIPEEINPIHYYHNANGQVECFEVDEEFYTTHRFGTRPIYPLKTEKIDYSVKRITSKELATFYKKENSFKSNKNWLWAIQEMHRIISKIIKNS